MDPEIIWRVREKQQLERCFQLACAEFPEAEREGPGAETVADTFAWQMSRRVDGREFALPREDSLEWAYGRIRIKYRVVPTLRVVEVLEVTMAEASPW